jgi:ferredoxin-NADP reductase
LRSYSIASPPQRRGELSLVVRLVPGGVASERFRRLEPGQGLQFTGPMGFFVNELAHSGDIVYVATGTGIAPIVPMVQEALERPAASDGDGKLHLYWGLRSEEDLFYRDELTALTARHPRLTCQIYLSQPQGFYRPRGRVSGPVLELLPSLRSPTFYLCGNGQMIEELKSGLVGRGVQRKRQIRTEAFFD